MKTAVDLSALVRQRTWDKDVVLWIGSEKELLNAIGPIPHATLDLLDLFDEERLPMDDDETRAHLIRGLRERLRALQVGPAKRTVLVVKSIGLLARYDAGVKEFYEWFCCDFAMVVLVLDGPIAGHSWPDEVVCDADRLLKYFQRSDVVKHVFGEKV